MGDVDRVHLPLPRGDVEAFLQRYWRSPELTFSGTSGIARGWDAVLVRYRKSYPDRAAMGQLDFSQLEFRFLGPDSALVLGHWHLARDKGDIAQAHEQARAY